MADISKLEQQENLLFDNIAGFESSTLQRIGKRIDKYIKNFPCRNVIKSVYLVIALIAAQKWIWR